jgi:hypothetical protein
MNPKTLIKPKTTDINASPMPHHHCSTNVSTLSYTLYPGTTTQYQNTSENNPLEVAMKKPSGIPKTKLDYRHVLRPHPKHKGIHLLGVTYQEDSTSGTQGQDGLTMKNNPEMKRMFWNEVAVRTMMWTIW